MLWDITGCNMVPLQHFFFPKALGKITQKKQIKRRQNKWLWWKRPAMPCNLAQVEHWKILKGLLAPMFSSSETAAAAAAVLAVGSDCGKTKRRNSCKKRKKNLATDLFIDRPELLHEQKPAEAIQSVKKIFEYARKTNYHGYTWVGMWGNLTFVHTGKYRPLEFLCHILGACSHKETLAHIQWCRLSK